MARAYNRSWSLGTCPAHSTAGSALSSAYFNKINATIHDFDYRDINVGDVLEFGDHAAYVVGVPYRTRYNIPDGIDVDHKLGPAVYTEYDVLAYYTVEQTLQADR